VDIAVDLGEVSLSPELGSINVSQKPLPNPPRECIFCGKRGKLSGEHIFPQWFSKIVPRSDQRHYSVRADVKNLKVEMDDPAIRREGDLASRKIKAPCKECNERWMSEIETAAIPILSPLILGKPTNLSREGQITLATWATLKTLVIEASFVATDRGIPAQSAKDFYKTRLPLEHWNIWIGRYNGCEWAKGGKRIFHCGALYGPTSLDSIKNYGRFERKNVQTTTVCAGQLFIHILSHTPELNLKMEFKGDIGAALVQVLPYHRDVDWPPADSIDDDLAGLISMSLGAGLA